MFAGEDKVMLGETTTTGTGDDAVTTTAGYECGTAASGVPAAAAGALADFKNSYSTGSVAVNSSN